MEMLFREMHGAVSQSCLAVRDAIRRERDQLNPEIAFYEKMKNRIATVHIGSSIKLDVGGTVFRTSKSTLTKEPGSMLAAMFSGSIPPGRQDEDGTYFIDRSGKHFGTILNYLRTGVFIQPYDPVSVEELKVELDYYGILSKLYPQAVFVFSDSHDNNGLFYWIGCSMGSLPYTDPASKPNLVTVENGFHQAPSILIGHPTFGRDTPGVCGDAKGKSFTVKFTIKTWFFQPNYYTMSFSGKCVSSWTLYGSCDNGTTWENLSEILNITPNTSSCGSWPITTSHKFNQFRVTPAPMDTCFHAYGLELYGSLSS
ncbi:K+ channel tetramerization subfamily protein [Pelomyxa schiedti]|nr:K+ channel tetramerization subfamily protein [Pelomyxa schiedti]